MIRKWCRGFHSIFRWKKSRRSAKFSNIDNDQQSPNNGFTLADFWLESICKKILPLQNLWFSRSNGSRVRRLLMFVTLKNHQKLSLLYQSFTEWFKGRCRRGCILMVSIIVLSLKGTPVALLDYYMHCYNRLIILYPPQSEAPFQKAKMSTLGR